MANILTETKTCNLDRLKPDIKIVLVELPISYINTLNMCIKKLHDLLEGEGNKKLIKTYDKSIQNIFIFLREYIQNLYTDINKLNDILKSLPSYNDIVYIITEQNKDTYKSKLNTELIKLQNIISYANEVVLSWYKVEFIIKVIYKTVDKVINKLIDKIHNDIEIKRLFDSKTSSSYNETEYNKNLLQNYLILQYLDLYWFKNDYFIRFVRSFNYTYSIIKIIEDDIYSYCLYFICTIVTNKK
jgi:hypothetical protein